MALVSAKNSWLVAKWLLVISLALAFSFYQASSSDDGYLHFYVLDVGQGSSSYVRTPGGFDLIFDGGKDETVLSELEKIMPWQDKDIDFLILSHPHLDHLGGLNHVLEKFQIKNILYTQALYESSAYDKFQELIAIEGANIEKITSPKSYLLPDGVELKILYPLKDYSGQKMKNIHQANVVAQIDYQEFEVLFPGDIEFEQEKMLIGTSQEIKSDILLAPHHGSKTSSSVEFLLAVMPSQIIISLGENNKYGHPHQQVTDRYSELNLPYWRTDREEEIHLISDGQKWWRESNP